MALASEGRTAANRGRLIVAKVGLDGHDRGARVVSRLLREEGFEVVFVGIRHTPEQIAQYALRDEVDVVGLSILSGAHVELTRAVRSELDALGCRHVPIIVGGLIPQSDEEPLREAGASLVFHPGDSGVDGRTVVEAMDGLVVRSRADRHRPPGEDLGGARPASGQASRRDQEKPHEE